MNEKAKNVIELFTNMFEYYSLLDENDYSFSNSSIINVPKVECSEDKQKVYKKMSISIIALIISLYKEECVGKTEDKKLYLKVNDNYLERIFANIIVEDKDNYKKIGDLSFSRRAEVFEKIRNKIAHGDFKLNVDYITIESDGLKGNIKFEDLYDFVLDLNNHYSSKFSNVYNRSFIFSTSSVRMRSLKNYKRTIINIRKFTRIMII